MSNGIGEPPQVSVLIVGHESWMDLQTCLPAIAGGCASHKRETTGAESLLFEIVVFDNASADGSVGNLCRIFPDVRVLASARNLGFAAGSNRAAEVALGDYFLLLNPDAVVDEGAISRAVECLSSTPMCGLLGGRTVLPDGRDGSAAYWRLPSLRSTLCWATGLSSFRRGSRWLDPETIGTPLVPAERKPLRVGAVSGCFLLVAAEVWRELGGFDERYFLYGEDLDLATRATAAGYTPAVDLAVTFRHRVGGSARSTATRRTAVLTGRVTWYLTTWSPAKARFAVLMLQFGVVLRCLAAMLGLASQDWSVSWAARAQWRDGYPALNASAPVRKVPLWRRAIPSRRS